MPMSKEIQDQANEVLTAYALKETNNAMHTVDQFDDDVVDRDEVVRKVENTNSWIDFISGDDHELYDKYRFRVFFWQGKFYIVQGEEIDVDIRRKGCE